MTQKARLILLASVAAIFANSPVAAKPIGPTLFCDTYPDAPSCLGGKPACSLCHQTTPPPRNSFGEALSAQMLPGAPRPLSDADYMANLPSALRAVEMLDSDGDGATNLDEITAGTAPSDASSLPRVGDCPGTIANANFKVCRYDRRYVFRKLNLDFCGRSPTFEQIESFDALTETEQQDILHTSLTACLASDDWLKKDGTLWKLAHRKVRPLQAIKSGPGAGVIPLGDYDDDYALFVYANSGDHDVRDVLTANYFVERTDPGAGGVTSYARVQDKSGQDVVDGRRAGVLTSKWSLVYFVMFTALPRTAAAQAYRGYLNLDIARLEGLNPVAGEPVDYDEKGVQAAACVVCHSTLDPLSYPFKNYTGLDSSNFGTYDANRMRRFRNEGADILQMPEAGSIFGTRVNDLIEWARVAADNDAFPRAVVQDFWRLTVGTEPDGDEAAEFGKLWTDLKGKHNYRVESMLHDLIETEAYGVP